MPSTKPSRQYQPPTWMLGPEHRRQIERVRDDLRKSMMDGTTLSCVWVGRRAATEVRWPELTPNGHEHVVIGEGVETRDGDDRFAVAIHGSGAFGSAASRFITDSIRLFQILVTAKCPFIFEMPFDAGAQRVNWLLIVRRWGIGNTAGYYLPDGHEVVDNEGHAQFGVDWYTEASRAQTSLYETPGLVWRTAPTDDVREWSYLLLDHWLRQGRKGKQSSSKGAWGRRLDWNTAASKPAPTTRGIGGRPRLSERDRKIRYDLRNRWQAAKKAGTRRKDFASDNNVSDRFLEKVVSWCAQDERRRNLRS